MLGGKLELPLVMMGNIACNHVHWCERFDNNSCSHYPKMMQITCCNLVLLLIA